MYRNGPDGWWTHDRDIEGEWCDTMKAAKASYKEALRAFHALRSHSRTTS